MRFASARSHQIPSSHTTATGVLWPEDGTDRAPFHRIAGRGLFSLTRDAMLFAEGNLPTPTYEQLGLFIVCAWLLFSVATKVKQTWWSDGEKQIVARAELAERIALASRSIDELAG